MCSAGLTRHAMLVVKVRKLSGKSDDARVE